MIDKLHATTRSHGFTWAVVVVGCVLLLAQQPVDICNAADLVPPLEQVEQLEEPACVVEQPLRTHSFIQVMGQHFLWPIAAQVLVWDGRQTPPPKLG